MPRRKHSSRRKRLENLMRRIDISHVSVSVQLGTRTERGVEPEWHNYGHIELAGTMDEPVRDTRDIQITVYSTDNARLGKEPTGWIGARATPS